MNVFSVDWLYAWRWVAAIALGFFVGANTGLLFAAAIPFVYGVGNLLTGIVLMAVFSILYYLERKAGKMQSLRNE